MKQKYEFTAQELASFKKMLRAIEVFKKLSPSLPLSHMEGFLQVAIKQGLGTVEYAQRLEYNKDNTSRILGVMGERPRKLEEPYRLIEQCDDPVDSRKTHYYVTAKGNQVLKKVVQELEH